ncbi:2-keto-3-deoxy-galactonokinase [Flammeovirga pectinis]|uniref:2-keto-3-deoxy-galactonokinase n=1 Tax=Flammeovirga pectinis TaxID=2494373 RepID=A0A3Q9FQR3_9BACT|nr:2-dehydro-3-deoxygalactonokinase [Flammeovirga pectinis]AZQ64893.1 2-keto-3-deoxy-galactonokinase [Flammeovirga pectinis]
MSLPEKFISCDWGTSNFRLRLIKTDTLEVLDEHKTDKGVKKLYSEFQSQKRLNQDRFFSDYLTEQLKEVTSLEGENVVVASGMASSSIGMRELGYSAMPFDAYGKNLFSRSISLSKKLQILLVSGAKTKEDVMRGEEIQAVGLSEFLPIEKTGVLLLPGTHSKHLHYEKASYDDFKTFMTGELFEIISSQSILKSSLEKTDYSKKFEKSFIEGVKKGAEGFTASLFSIRAKDLMKNATKQENYFFLSGLLIGDELAYLNNDDSTISVAANGTLGDLYKLALEEILDDNSRLNFIEEEVLEKALLIGQRKILESYEK